MVLVAILAVDWVVMKAGYAALQWATSRNLSLAYSWVPDRENLPPNEPVYPESTSILEDRLEDCLALLVFGVPPMASLLGLVLVRLLTDLMRRGGCSPFLFGFLASGSGLLFSYVACSILATEWIMRHAEVSIHAVDFLASRIVGGRLGDELALAMDRAALILVLGWPQVILALLGARLNERKLRVTLMIVPYGRADAPDVIQLPH